MIAILTDCTGDIPEELVAQYAIRIVPQYIIWGECQYLNREVLSPQTF